MDVFDINWKTVAEFLQKYSSPKAFWSRRLHGRLLVVFSTLLNFNGLNTIKISLFWQDISSIVTLNMSISVIYIECLVLNVILRIYNISPLVVTTMQFFQTIVILIDFEMKQAGS